MMKKWLLALAFAGNLEELRAAMEQGADLHARSPLGSSLLIQASMNGCVGTVEWLLQAGAEIELATQTGITALWAAGCQGHREVVSILLAHGASLLACSQNTEAAEFPIVREIHNSIH